MRTADEINTDIENKNIERGEKQEEIDNFEIDTDSKDEQFCDMLNETNEGLFSVEYAELMRQHDNTMFRCGLNDYVDSLEVSDEEDYKTLEEELETLNDELDELEEELEEAEANEE